MVNSRRCLGHLVAARFLCVGSTDAELRKFLFSQIRVRTYQVPQDQNRARVLHPEDAPTIVERPQ